jgi:hypothetical protein
MVTLEIRFEVGTGTELYDQWNYKNFVEMEGPTFRSTVRWFVKWCNKTYFSFTLYDISPAPLTGNKIIDALLPMVHFHIEFEVKHSKATLQYVSLRPLRTKHC